MLSVGRFICNCFGNGIPEGIVKVIRIVYTGIRLVVPLILIIIGMIDMGKAITKQSEDEIKKAQQLLVKKAIAAALVFLIFSLVSLVIGVVDDNSAVDLACIKCILNGEDTSTPVSEPVTSVSTTPASPTTPTTPTTPTSPTTVGTMSISKVGNFIASNSSNMLSFTKFSSIDECNQITLDNGNAYGLSIDYSETSYSDFGKSCYLFFAPVSRDYSNITLNFSYGTRSANITLNILPEIVVGNKGTRIGYYATKANQDVAAKFECNNCTIQSLSQDGSVTIMSNTTGNTYSTRLAFKKYATSNDVSDIQIKGYSSGILNIHVGNLAPGYYSLEYERHEIISIAVNE